MRPLRRLPVSTAPIVFLATRQSQNTLPQQGNGNEVAFQFGDYSVRASSLKTESPDVKQDYDRVGTSWDAEVVLLCPSCLVA